MCLQVDYTPAAAVHGLVVPCVKVVNYYGPNYISTPFSGCRVFEDGWIRRRDPLNFDLDQGAFLRGQGVHAYDCSRWRFTNEVGLVHDEKLLDALAIGVLAWEEWSNGKIYELCSLAMIVHLKGKNDAQFNRIKKIAGYHERSRRRALERELPHEIRWLLAEYDQIEW